MTDRALSVTVSLYQSQIDKIKKYVKDNKLKSEAAFFQEIIDSFFKRDENSLKRDTFIYLIIPIGFWVLSYYVMNSLTNMETILLNQSLYFNELTILKSIFQVFTFFFLTMIVVSVVLLYWKYKYKRWGY